MNGYILVCVHHGHFDNDKTRCFETFEEAQREMLTQFEDARLRLREDGCHEVSDVHKREASIRLFMGGVHIGDVRWTIKKVKDV